MREYKTQVTEKQFKMLFDLWSDVWFFDTVNITEKHSYNNSVDLTVVTYTEQDLQTFKGITETVKKFI